MKVALLADIAPYGMKGLKNYVVSKSVFLQKRTDENFHVDFYIVNTVLSPLLCKILKIDRKRSLCYGAKEIELDGVTFKLIFIHRNLFHVLYERVTKRIVSYSWQLRKISKRLRGYDIITCHSITAHRLALMTNELYGIPYVTTFHGSDTTVYPFEKASSKEFIAKVIKSASMNFYVSKGLMKFSDKITSEGVKDHIYTGVAQAFYEYPDEKKSELRKNHHVVGKKVVAFSGNLFQIKNPMSLPPIFDIVHRSVGDKCVFWIIGDGPLRDTLKKELDAIKVEYTMFGNIKPENMPEMMNCCDVVILPSINEGFGLSVLEARICGAVGVGSRVGGIPEAVGEENVFDLDEDFTENISKRIIEILNNNERPKPLSDEFTWDSAVDKEINVFKKVLGEQ